LRGFAYEKTTSSGNWSPGFRALILNGYAIKADSEMDRWEFQIMDSSGSWHMEKSPYTSKLRRTFSNKGRTDKASSVGLDVANEVAICKQRIRISAYCDRLVMLFEDLNLFLHGLKS
jgi:hypothetical protein